MESREIRVRGDEGANIIIEVDSRRTIIRENKTSDKEVFESLDYHAGDKYSILDQGRGSVRTEVYSEFFSLMNEICEGINALSDPEEVVKEQASDIATEEDVISMGLSEK